MIETSAEQKCPPSLFVECEAGGSKDLNGKRRIDLVPPEVIYAFAEACQTGLVKGYSERNWEKGIDYSKTYAAALRHLLKWFSGIDKDTETGANHIDLALWNVGVLATQTRRNRDDLDDRPKGG